MLQRLTDSWRELREGSPGTRFQEHYRRRQQDAHRRWRKPLFIGGGLVVIAAGLVFLPAPGPGTLIVLIGSALIAQESLVTARLLDKIEVRLRELAAWALQVWQRWSVPVRVLLVLGILVLAGGAAYVGYRLMFAG